MKMVIFRGALYFLIACIPVLIENFTPIAEGTVHATSWGLLVSCMSGFLAGLIALRAYVDGSYQRHMDQKGDSK